MSQKQEDQSTRRSGARNLQKGLGIELLSSRGIKTRAMGFIGTAGPEWAALAGRTVAALAGRTDGLNV